MHLVQINLQRGFGGGEIYTCFLGRALRALGHTFDLIANARAHWWQDYDTGASTVYPISGHEEIPALSFARPTWLLYHTPDGGPRLATLREQGCRTASFVHMPLYQRRYEHFRDYDLLIAVSEYVRTGLLDHGLVKTHGEALYGVAYLDRSSGEDGPLVARSRYSWDTRKLRDRVLSWIEPAIEALRRPQPYTSGPGLTLGIVSRITPIKQFPTLFGILAPILAQHAGLTLDIFGSGGYASVRDTRRALAPLGARARWWGEQRDVRRVYGTLDYLLTGLPEKEALGLNVLEAQICGTPVLAPDAPPFTETIAGGRSGYFYPDPRLDEGRGFAHLLASIVAGTLPRPDPLRAPEHLARFSERAFRERVFRLVTALEHA